MDQRSIRGAVAVAGCVGAVAVAGCGGDERSVLEVVATTGIVADLTAGVAGEGVEVIQIVPDGSSPHAYRASPPEQQRIADADLLVYVDEALEADLPLSAAGRRFSLAAAAGEGPAGDPHVWMDPTAVAAALPALGEALAEVDPPRAAVYRRRAREQVARMKALDRELERIVATLPVARRQLATSHEVLGWFAARYGFELIGSPVGLAPEASADARTADDLLARIEAAGVPAVFAQRGDDPELLGRIAAAAGVELVDDLLVESLSTDAPTYAAMMRLTTRRIVAALGR